MKLHPRHIIAAPFLLLAAWILFDLLRHLPKELSHRPWDVSAFKIFFGGIVIFVVAVPGVLALKRRWEEFVKIIGFCTALYLFTLVSRDASDLARTTEDLIRADHPLLGALWGGCVVFSPFAVSIGAYKLFVPRIIRRIQNNSTAAPLS